MKTDNTPMYFEKVQIDCPICGGSKTTIEHSRYSEWNVECNHCYGTGKVFDYKPLQLVSEISDEEIEKIRKKISCSPPYDAPTFKQGWRECESKLTPTIAVLKKEKQELNGVIEHYKTGSRIHVETICELEQQLSAEKENSRENSTGFTDWLVWNNYVPFGLPLQKENLFHKQGYGTRITLSELYDIYLTSLTDKQSEGK